jgi:hypothetical protein
MVLSLTSQSFGYGVQARYTLFVPGIVAMCAFVQPRREVPVIVERVAVVVVALFVGAMHFATMLINGERHAVGLTSRPLSFSHSVWSPPTGWPAALTLCAVASAGVTACVAVAGWSGQRPSAESVGE